MAGRRIVWTPEMDAALVAARQKRLNHLACSERVGVSVQYIAPRLRHLGLPVGFDGRRGRTKAERMARA